MMKPCNRFSIISAGGPASMDAKGHLSRTVCQSKTFFWVAMSAFVLFSTNVFTGCQSNASGLTREQYRQGATALFQQQLYQEAANFYDAYLKSPVITTEDAPKVIYQIGVIYQENLRDCQGALARFTVLKALYPDATFDGQVGKRMVNCLETVGRSTDASQAMAKLTDMNPSDSGNLSATSESGSVVADLDGRKITWGEVAAAFGKMPDDAKTHYDAVRSYVAQILIAQAARRKGLTDQAEVKKRLAQIEDQVLAGEMLRGEVKVPTPSGNDLKYFYEGNKTRYQVGADSGKSFEDLQAKVAYDWQREKAAEQTNAYIEKLLSASPVNFYTPQADGKKP
jgi:tetratricopeptide (TPR) repeat protein